MEGKASYTISVHEPEDQREHPIFHLMDRPIAFHRIFVTITGSIVGALMLSQAVYWSRRTSNPAGWFYKTQDEWELETGMSRREQETARRQLRKHPWWQEELRKVNGAPVLHYRIDASGFAKTIADCTNRNWRIPPNGNGAIRQMEMAQSANSIYKEAETTTETTEDTSLRDVQVASATHSQPVPPPHTDGAAVCDEDPAAVQEAADEVLPLFASDGNVAQAHTQSAKSSATTRKKSDYAKKSTGYVNETTGVSTNDIRAAYYALLEQHEPGAVPNHGETGRSAKNLAQAGWTPDAIERCYADMKREPFYARKHVALVEIAKQIGARVGSVAPPQTKPAAPKLDGLRNESGRLLVVARVGLEERLKFMSDSEIPHSQARPATREDIDAAAAQKGLTAKDYMHLVLYYDGPLPE